MIRLRTLCVAIVVATLPMGLVSCGGGGSSPTDEVLGVVAEKGNSEGKKDSHSGSKGDSKKEGDGDSAEEHDDTGDKDNDHSGGKEGSKEDHNDHAAEDNIGNSISANKAGGNNNSDSQVDISQEGEGTHSPSNNNQVVNITMDLPISIASNIQQQPIVAYQPMEQRSLVVWNDQRNRDGFDYYGWGDLRSACERFE